MESLRETRRAAEMIDRGRQATAAARKVSATI
jgi:hypothetical protein